MDGWTAWTDGQHSSRPRRMDGLDHTAAHARACWVSVCCPEAGLDTSTRRHDWQILKPTDHHLETLARPRRARDR